MSDEEKGGSSVAQAALLKATLAFDRIEQHEKQCANRWGLVVKLLFFGLAQMTVVLGVLVYDKVM